MKVVYFFIYSEIILKYTFPYVILNVVFIIKLNLSQLPVSFPFSPLLRLFLHLSSSQLVFVNYVDEGTLHAARMEIKTTFGFQMFCSVID